MEYRLTFLASVFMKKVNWNQTFSMVEATSNMAGTQGRKGGEQVKEHFCKLDVFRLVGIRWSLFWATQSK